MAATQKREATDADVERLIRQGMFALGAGAVLFVSGMGLRLTGDTDLSTKLVGVGALGLILGFPLVGAVPPYLAGRKFGFPFTQIVRSPFRWGKGARGIRAFGRVKSIKGVDWAGFGLCVQHGADPETLVRAIELRAASKWPVSMEALVAAALVGFDVERVAREEDVLAALAHAQKERSER